MNSNIRTIKSLSHSVVVIAVCYALLACGGGGGDDGGDPQNPLPQTQATVDAGNAIYHGKGVCNVCHGDTGKGDGSAGAVLSPPPTDFTSPQFQASRTDAQMFSAVKNGIPGTGMISFNPAMINDTETWQVIAYIRSLNGT
jgi:mono/diheme cytochrome c family protein